MLNASILNKLDDSLKAHLVFICIMVQSVILFNSDIESKINFLAMTKKFT